MRITVNRCDFNYDNEEIARVYKEYRLSRPDVQLKKYRELLNITTRRLAAYEDTKRTPREIYGMQCEIDKLRTEVHRLMEENENIRQNYVSNDVLKMLLEVDNAKR